MKRTEYYVSLTTSAWKSLRLPVKGSGGFQTLLRGIQRKMGTVGVLLTGAEVKRIWKYWHRTGTGGFQDRLAALLPALIDIRQTVYEMDHTND
jgi:hypothetical protein